MMLAKVAPAPTTINTAGSAQHINVDEDANKDVEFSIVGPYEANLEKGLISVSSPLAKGLLGKENGSQVEIKTPSGLKNYEILNIDILK